jgi:putative membrane protein
MILAALLSAIHVLTLALGLGAVVMRGRALAHPLDHAGWKRLLAADDMWGLAALLWITTGLGRVFLGGKETSFYWRNGFFWTKMALFVLIFALELKPMITFVRARVARRRGAALPSFPRDTFHRVNAAETALVVAIVFAAAFMARGAWLF